MNAIFMRAQRALQPSTARGGAMSRVAYACSVCSSSSAAATQREARDHAVRVEAVRRASGIVEVGRVARLLERERHKLHARRIQVLVVAAARMHAVEAADDEVVDHVDDGFGDRAVDLLEA